MTFLKLIEAPGLSEDRIKVFEENVALEQRV
jgi:hypothetical protein